MNRAQIEREYEIRDGRIKSPGKFEGEMIYMPYFYAVSLDGGADFERPGGVYGMRIQPGDRAMFPELGRRRQTVKWIERSDGFVVEV